MALSWTIRWLKCIGKLFSNPFSCTSDFLTCGSHSSRSDIHSQLYGRPLGCVNERKWWDSNPRKTFLPSLVFKTSALEPLCHTSLNFGVNHCTYLRQQLIVLPLQTFDTLVHFFDASIASVLQ